MVRLKNIKIDDKTAAADFYPEDSDTAGHIVVNLENEEITQLVKVDNIGWGVSHIRRELVKMAQENSTDTERIILWY